MLLTRAAANLIAEAVYSPACPFFSYNDVTIGRCAWAVGVALAHSPLFDPEAAHILEGSTFRIFDHDGGVRSALVIHRSTPARMAELQAMVDRFPEDTALADGLPSA